MSQAVGNHNAKAYSQNDYFSTQAFKRMQRKHPEAVKQAIEFNDQKAAFESGKLKALPEDTYIGASKKGIKDKAKGAIDSITSKLKGLSKGQKIVAGVVAAVAAIGIGAGVIAAKNKNAETQAPQA